MWRASTSVLLCQSTREYGLEAADIRTDILQTLRSLNKITPAGMEDELKRLIGDAIELDFELNKQVALYQVVRFEAYNKRYGFPVKLGYATIYSGEPPTERHTVKLVVTPCLTKSGDSLGEHYNDYGMVIVESQVEVYPLVETVSNVGNGPVSIERRLLPTVADRTSADIEIQRPSLHDIYGTAASLSSGTGKSQTHETSGGKGHKIISVVRRYLRDAIEDTGDR
nr:hypothetical protein CFP56_09549 [Quercus suber]